LYTGVPLEVTGGVDAGGRRPGLWLMMPWWKSRPRRVGVARLSVLVRIFVFFTHQVAVVVYANKF